MLEFKRYNPSHFHDDGSLKVSALLWLIVLYLSRHLLVLMVGGLSTFMGSRSGLDTSGLSILYSSPAFLPASLPALVVLVARLRRVAGAGSFVRWVWRGGRYWLIAAALIDLTTLAVHWTLGWLGTTQMQVAGAFVDAYIMVYLVRSRRARDLFRDFPTAQ
jgi:hypothetical protein